MEASPSHHCNAALDRPRRASRSRAGRTQRAKPLTTTPLARRRVHLRSRTSHRRRRARARLQISRTQWDKLPRRRRAEISRRRTRTRRLDKFRARVRHQISRRRADHPADKFKRFGSPALAGFRICRKCTQKDIQNGGHASEREPLQTGQWCVDVRSVRGVSLVTQSRQPTAV
jgi:hypothetical protein